MIQRGPNIIETCSIHYEV